MWSLDRVEAITGTDDGVPLDSPCMSLANRCMVVELVFLERTLDVLGVYKLYTIRVYEYYTITVLYDHIV